MPRKVKPKLCGCGCRTLTKGGIFMPGHDSRTLSAIIDHAGGILELKRIIEDVLDCRIKVNGTHSPKPQASVSESLSRIDEKTLDRYTADKIERELLKDGYKPTSKVMYVRFTKSHGDSAFINHSLNVVRCTVNTRASEITEKYLGKPNGIASEEQDARFNSWFLNGYIGKAGTSL